MFEWLGLCVNVYFTLRKLWLWLVFFKYIIQCLVSEIWKMNRTSSFICASILRILTNTIVVIQINRNTSLWSYIRTCPQPQAVLQWHLSIQKFLPLCVQLWSTKWARSAFLWLTKMWRHDNNMHVKHTQSSCFINFSFVFLAKPFCPLSAFPLATSGSWLSGNICLVILLLVCFRSDGKALACPSGCLTDRRCFWIYL